MNFHWIILYFHVTLLAITLCEAGKKGSESGIIVINNTGGGKCGGNAKTIVKTAPKGKKGKGGKGKGHTIIASSGGGGGGGGCSSSCKCGGGDHGHEKVVAVPVPVPVTVLDNKFMHRRQTGYEATAGTRMMPVFVSANSPISIAGSPSSNHHHHQQQSSLHSYGYNDAAASAGSVNPFVNSFASNFMPSHSHLRAIGDHGLFDPSTMSASEARQMFSLLPAQQLGHHFAHSVNHGRGHGHVHGHHGYSHHSNGAHAAQSSSQYPQSFNVHGDSGMIMQDSPIHHPVPYNSMPIYEPIRPDEEYMGMNYGESRGTQSGLMGPRPSPSSSSSPANEDERTRAVYQAAAASISQPSAASSEPLRKPANYDDSPASPSSSLPISPDSKDKTSSGYWPERA